MKRCPTCRKPLKTDLRAGSYVHICGGEFEIAIPHPDADVCRNCGAVRFHHIADMILCTGAGACFDFAPEYLEVSA